VNPINMLQAKSSLSKLVESLEQGKESEIVIARPVARLVPYKHPVTDKRIGVAKGRFEVPDDIDADNEKLARLFKDGRL
jgi:antitoxin (DNA-binding transcriptional repressor) of toxin-antitoxin stability system